MEGTVGIWTSKGPPTPRDPIVLINDPSYANCDPSDAGSSLAPRWIEDFSVGIRLNPDIGALEPGTKVLMMCPSDQPPGVWASGTGFQQVGVLNGPGAETVAEFIRTAHSGLGGRIVSGGLSSEGARVIIPPPNFST